MKKVIVLGCPGSGKSCFSRTLHDKTGLPLIHLDNIWWIADKTHISQNEFDAELALVLQKEAWIIDGDYSRTYEERINACDTVFFLDYPQAVCIDGITRRIGKERPDMPWTEEKTDPELVKLVTYYDIQNKPVIQSLLKKYSMKEIHIFSDRNEASSWLEGLKYYF